MTRTRLHWQALPGRPKLCTACNIRRGGGRHCGPGDCIQYYQYYLLEYYIILPILHNITAGPGSGSCRPGEAPRPAGLLSPPAGPGARRAGLVAELPLPRRTLANAAHKLDDSGQLSSASPGAYPGPRTPEPGGLGQGRVESGDLLTGSEWGGLGRVSKKTENSSLDMACNILR